MRLPDCCMAKKRKAGTRRCSEMSELHPPSHNVSARQAVAMTTSSWVAAGACAAAEALLDSSWISVISRSSCETVRGRRACEMSVGGLRAPQSAPLAQARPPPPSALGARLPTSPRAGVAPRRPLRRGARSACARDPRLRPARWPRARPWRARSRRQRPPGRVARAPQASEAARPQSRPRRRCSRCPRARPLTEEATRPPPRPVSMSDSPPAATAAKWQSETQ